MRDAARDARHPVRGRRPDRASRSTTCRPSARRTGTAGCRDAAPARARPPPDRRHRRARRDPVQPGPHRRLPGGDGRGRRARRPDPDQLRRVPRRGGHRSRAGSCSRCRDRPTAIFAGNDLQALGVYQAAREARLHIPEDLSVVGFDDLPVARWVGPPLTTVRQPLMEMADGRGRDRRRAGARRGAAADAGRAGDGAGRPGEHGAAGVGPAGGWNDWVASTGQERLGPRAPGDATRAASSDLLNQSSTDSSSRNSCRIRPRTDDSPHGSRRRARPIAV